MKQPDHEWRMHFALFSVTTLPNGEKASGQLMRRKINGKWQYREPTQAEIDEYLSVMSW